MRISGDRLSNVYIQTALQNTLLSKHADFDTADSDIHSW